MKTRLKRDRHLKLAAEELLLQPWFLPVRISKAMWSLLPADFRKRLRDVFDDYGCIRCGRNNIPYRSNGMCGPCFLSVFHMVCTSANRRSKERLRLRYGKEFMAKERTARQLLAGLVSNRKAKRLPIRRVELGNPTSGAIETFG